MDFDLPPDLVAYLGELDEFIEAAIRWRRTGTADSA